MTVQQLSLFGADAAPVSPGDLEGLLAGPGEVTRLGGTARISVVVPDSWRARALLAEFAIRGVTGVEERIEAAELNGAGSGGVAEPDAARSGEATEPRGAASDEETDSQGAASGQVTDPDATGSGDGTGPHAAGSTAAQDPHHGAGANLRDPYAAGSSDAAVAGHIGVRTAFSRSLAPVAQRWIRGAVTAPPEGFRLTGPMLRLWFIAAGQPLGRPSRPTQGVLLGLSVTRQATWRQVGAALAAAGLRAALVGTRGKSPAYRIVGRRQVARLVELIGTRPDAAPVEAWPRIVSSPPRAGSSGDEGT